MGFRNDQTALCARLEALEARVATVDELREENQELRERIACEVVDGEWPVVFDLAASGNPRRNAHWRRPGLALRSIALDDANVQAAGITAGRGRRTSRWRLG